MSTLLFPTSNRILPNALGPSYMDKACRFPCRPNYFIFFVVVLRPLAVWKGRSVYKTRKDCKAIKHRIRIARVERIEILLDIDVAWESERIHRKILSPASALNFFRLTFKKGKKWSRSSVSSSKLEFQIGLPLYIYTKGEEEEKIKNGKK